MTVPAAPGRWSVYATQSGGSISWGDTFEVAGSTEVDIRLADRIAARDDAARRDRERRRADSIAEVRRRRRADSIARARRADSIAEAERGRTSSAARRIVFSETGDRFSGERIWDESDNAACERLYSGGRYILRSKAEGSFCASYLTSLGDVSGPVRIEAVTHLASGPTNQQLGIIFGHQGNSYFVAGMSGNGSFKLARRNADGSWTDVLTWQGADAAHSGRGVDNHHAVEIRGRRIDYFLNGSFVNAFEAGRSLEGGVGLYNNGNLMEVRYDDFKISNIEADDRATRMRRTFYSPSGETFEGERFWSTTWSGSAASNCSSEYTAGGFVMRSRTEGRACLTWLSRLGSLSGPLTIKGTVSLRNGPLNRHYGIRVAISDGDYIVAGINGNGSVRLARWTGSQWVYPTDWERNSAVRTGLNARNELEVRIDGRRMTFYVNGTQVQTATIDRDLVGGIGLYVGSQMEVLYDNLRVTKR
ncbi:MAG: hypothetical protein D6701_07705 [Gemmatimonadetes bacterium]|nr:MAG: hypothetical protein D6701_07705 [Gemmatimonadota bacterium]